MKPIYHCQPKKTIVISEDFANAGLNMALLTLVGLTKQENLKPRNVYELGQKVEKGRKCLALVEHSEWKEGLKSPSGSGYDNYLLFICKAMY